MSMTSPIRLRGAILTSLSAGGVSLITFLAPPHAKVFKMTLTIPGIDNMPVEGKVVRVHQKGETFVGYSMRTRSGIEVSSLIQGLGDGK